MLLHVQTSGRLPDAERNRAYQISFRNRPRKIQIQPLREARPASEVRFLRRRVPNKQEPTRSKLRPFRPPYPDGPVHAVEDPITAAPKQHHAPDDRRN